MKKYRQRIHCTEAGFTALKFDVPSVKCDYGGETPT